jgi:pimeloyl-ACP methyl ester carboxylesterase
MAQRIIFFSGMGADERAFQYLDLGDFEGVYLNWKEPKEDETLNDYALRMVTEVEIVPTDIIVGLSMGGMVAQIIAASFTVKKVIIISSLRSGETLQPLFTAAQRLKLMKLVQKDLLKSTILKGLKIYLPLEDERLQLIIDMLDCFSGNYYKWAMNAVLNWQGANANCPVYHIHGSKDELFPIAQVKDAEIIDGGRHLMIVTRPDEVSRIMMKFIHA